MGVFVIESWAYWLLVSGLFVSAVAAIAEAWVRRRESAAIKENAVLRDEAQRRQSWLRKAKKQAGFSDNISFDVVWAEVLEVYYDRHKPEA